MPQLLWTAFQKSASANYPNWWPCKKVTVLISAFFNCQDSSRSNKPAGGVSATGSDGKLMLPNKNQIPREKVQSSSRLWEHSFLKPLAICPVQKGFFSDFHPFQISLQFSSGILNQKIRACPHRTAEKPAQLIRCTSQSVLNRWISANQFTLVEGPCGFCKSLLWKKSGSSITSLVMTDFAPLIACSQMPVFQWASLATKSRKMWFLSRNSLSSWLRKEPSGSTRNACGFPKYCVQWLRKHSVNWVALTCFRCPETITRPILNLEPSSMQRTKWWFSLVWGWVQTPMSQETVFHFGGWGSNDETLRGYTSLSAHCAFEALGFLDNIPWCPSAFQSLNQMTNMAMARGGMKKVYFFLMDSSLLESEPTKASSCSGGVWFPSWNIASVSFKQCKHFKSAPCCCSSSQLQTVPSPKPSTPKTWPWSSLWGHRHQRRSSIAVDRPPWSRRHRSSSTHWFLSFWAIGFWGVATPTMFFSAVSSPESWSRNQPWTNSGRSSGVSVTHEAVVEADRGCLDHEVRQGSWLTIHLAFDQTRSTIQIAIRSSLPSVAHHLHHLLGIRWGRGIGCRRLWFLLLSIIKVITSTTRLARSGSRGGWSLRVLWASKTLLHTSQRLNWWYIHSWFRSSYVYCFWSTSSSRKTCQVVEEVPGSSSGVPWGPQHRQWKRSSQDVFLWWIAGLCPSIHWPASVRTRTVSELAPIVPRLGQAKLFILLEGCGIPIPTRYPVLVPAHFVLRHVGRHWLFPRPQRRKATLDHKDTPSDWASLPCKCRETRHSEPSSGQGWMVNSKAVDDRAQRYAHRKIISSFDSQTLQWVATVMKCINGNCNIYIYLYLMECDGV